MLRRHLLYPTELRDHRASTETKKRLRFQGKGERGAKFDLRKGSFFVEEGPIADEITAEPEVHHGGAGGLEIAES
jgi:hypothetical protein